MIVYRICQTYPPDHNPIDGMGAFKNGGRWNSKGTYAVYTASSLALARAEMARRINLESIPDGYRVYEIFLPDEVAGTEIEPLPDDWKDDPIASSTQRMGDELLKNPDVLYIKTPSVCDANSNNYILNPMSTQYGQVKVVSDYPFVA